MNYATDVEAVNVVIGSNLGSSGTYTYTVDRRTIGEANIVHVTNWAGCINFNEKFLILVEGSGATAVVAVRAPNLMSVVKTLT